MQVETVQDHLYGGENKKPGDVYDAEPRFVDLLVKMGYVKTRELMAVEQSPAAPAKSGSAPDKNRYNRRDLRAK